MMLSLEGLFNFLLLSFKIGKDFFLFINLAPLFYALCIKQILGMLLFDHGTQSPDPSIAVHGCLLCSDRYLTRCVKVILHYLV
jgi:hypothetical protein